MRRALALLALVAAACGSATAFAQEAAESDPAPPGGPESSAPAPTDASAAGAGEPHESGEQGASQEDDGEQPQGASNATTTASAPTLTWGAGLIIGQHQLSVRALFGFDVSGRYTAGFEGAYGIQVTPEVELHATLGYRRSSLCNVADPSMLSSPENACDDTRADYDFASLGAGASFLYGDNNRMGWFIDPHLMFGPDAPGYAALAFGLASRFAFVVSTHQSLFFEARLFAEPWIPFESGWAAPIYFGVSGAVAFGAGVMEVPPTHAQEAQSELDDLARDTLDELVGEGADPDAACAMGVRREWSDVVAACGDRLLAQLEPHTCALWVAHDPDEHDVDLRAWIGRDGARFDGEGAQAPVAAAQDAAPDNWPIVTLCNPTSEATDVHLAARAPDAGNASVLVRRYAVRAPRAIESAPDQPESCASADGATRLPASGCCLATLRDRETPITLERPDAARRIAIAAPYYANGVIVSELGAGSEASSRTLEPLAWREGAVVDLGPESDTVRLRSRSVGIPIEICAVDVGAVARRPAALADLGGSEEVEEGDRCELPLREGWSEPSAACSPVLARPIPAQRCGVWFAADAGADIDLRVSAGELGASDEGPDGAPFVVVCNPTGTDLPVTLEARIVGAPLRWASVARQDVPIPDEAGAATACGDELRAEPACCWAHVSGSRRLGVPAGLSAVSVSAPAFAAARTSLGDARPTRFGTLQRLVLGGQSTIVLETGHASPVLLCSVSASSGGP